MLIKVSQLYSRLVDKSATSGVSWHQQATWEALSDPSVDAVINMALTADGKSYAAFGAYPDGGVMAFYPTNELVRDQERQLKNYRTQGYRVRRLTGYDLEQWSRAARQSKAETLLDLANSEVLLTNPDLFYYLHQGNYLKDFLKQNKGNSLDLWGQIDRNFEALIFDEFHLYQPPQVSGVLNTLLLMQSVGIKHKYIFLSATPHLHLIKCLELAGLNYRVIQGQYNIDGGLGYRSISQPFTVQLEPCDRGEGWIEEHKAEILRFFLDKPGSKGAIILNSIASVKRTCRHLQKLFKPHGLRVTENTGFTGHEEAREAIASGDLVVGTSTLDVGIDFKINLLLFEGHDAPTFIQRLGRLGRHSGFEEYKAIAFVPRYFVERMQMSCPTEVDRLTLNQLVFQQHRKVNTFTQYYKRWSPVQALVVGQQLGHPDLQGQYLESANRYRQACEKLYGQNFRIVNQQRKQWGSEAAVLRVSNLIVAEARSFRGTSSLQAAVLDGKRATTYSLPGILSNYSYEILDKKDFGRTAPSFVEHCQFHFKVLEVLEKRRYWNFYLEETRVEKLSGKLMILAGLQVDCDEQVSFILRRSALVSFIVPQRAEDLRSRLRLPLHFPLYELKTRPHDRYHIYSIAFDQAALMLDAYLGQGEVIDRGMIACHSKQVLETEAEEDEAFLLKLSGFDWAESAPIILEPFPFSPREKAEKYYSYQGTSLDGFFGVVAFLRHEYTNYEEVLRTLNNNSWAVPGAYERLKERFNQAILTEINEIQASSFY